ncbi:MAG: EAL domain-containing protein [Bacilli bacterium]|nr:EAL domain-containing protein [Bacilli bacterium]
MEKTVKKKKRAIESTLKIIGLVSLIVSGAVIIATALFFILFLLTEKKVFVFIASILFVLFTAFAGFSVIYGVRKTYSSVFQNLINRTEENYDRLANLQQHLSHYDSNSIEELDNLNEKIDLVNNTLAKTVFSNIDHLYQYINLEYVDEQDNHLITIESFVKNHKQFVLNGEAFRNAFAFFGYPTINDDDMEDEFYDNLYKNIKNEFDDVNYLLAKDNKRHGFLCYLPNIDSLSFFREKLEKIVQNSIASKHEAGGALVYECQASAVIYPYSDVEDVLPDLRYAIRQGKAINIYTPERYNKANIPLYHTSLNQNNISKMFEQLAKERIDINDLARSKQSLQRILKRLGDHIGYETVGIAVYDINKAKYVIDYEESREGYDPVFKGADEFDKEFLNILLDCLDADGSYFFSKRSSVNDKLGKYLDLFGIQSGFFEVVMTEKGARSIIYYLNKTTTNFTVTAYDRESLVVFSNSIAGFSHRVNEESEVHSAERRYRSILRLTDHNLYAVDREDFTLVEMSDGLIDAVGKFERGDTCYKRIYGLDAPCKDCPLLKNSKMVSKVGKRSYTTSLILNRKKEDYPTLLMSPLDTVGQGQSINRYDPQLLIHSFYGLNERMNDLFLVKNRGYVLFLSIDNFDALIAKYGEEGYQNRLRFFFANYRRNKTYGEGEVYKYAPDKFAIVLPEEGRVDILNRSESIYNISLMKYDDKDEDEIPLSCTYVGFEYPANYNNAQEFFRNVNKYYKDNYKMLGQENFILPDTSYVRVVSREKFILSLLDDQIKSESLSLKYLPEVKSPSKKIIGAEILLRLTDKYRNEVLSPFEFIPVASKNNKIGTITNYLIARVGETYQKYGLSAFKLAGLRSISLNIDTTYFEDEHFIKQIESLINQFHFPKNFLRFEFNERDIADHYELMKSASKTLKGLDIYLTVDNYTGQFISIEKLKALRFENIKISRRLLADAAADQSKMAAVKNMVDSIKEFNLHYCYVGVEDKLQCQMLHEIDEEYVAQGYYFHKPLDIDVLLDELRISLN